MAKLFVDASGRKLKCYWEDNSCPNGKWYRIKAGLKTLDIIILLLYPIIGFLFWMFLGAELLFAVPVTIIFMAVYYDIFSYGNISASLEESKKIEDILIDNSPVYISVSKGLSCICFIIPEKKHMLFTILGYSDERLNSESAGWYIFKDHKHLEITDKYFQDPIEDLRSKLNYRCNLSSIINLKNSSSDMKKVLRSMQDISFLIFGK